uniref:Uncharacterized protein n=1 Tax=Romanomermis culicivorax TaxID=13658 RepID=A0A915K6V4_ROMCU
MLIEVSRSNKIHSFTSSCLVNCLKNELESNEQYWKAVVKVDMLDFTNPNEPLQRLIDTVSSICGTVNTVNKCKVTCNQQLKEDSTSSKLAMFCRRNNEDLKKQLNCSIWNEGLAVQQCSFGLKYIRHLSKFSTQHMGIQRLKDMQNLLIDVCTETSDFLDCILPSIYEYCGQTKAELYLDLIKFSWVSTLYVFKRLNLHNRLPSTCEFESTKISEVVSSNAGRVTDSDERMDGNSQAVKENLVSAQAFSQKCE